MPGLQKKVVNKYIKDRINWWAYSFKDVEILKEILDFSEARTTLTSSNEFTLPFNGEEGDAPELSDKEKLVISTFQQQIIDSVIVTGGCIASMLLGEEVNDIDVYFTDKEVAAKVAKYYLHTMIKSGKLDKNWKVSEIEVKDNTTNGLQIYIRSQGVAGEEVQSTSEYEYFELGDQNRIEEFFTAFAKAGGTKKNEDKPRHSVGFMSSNAISLQNGIQLIFRFIGDIDYIHKNFDFVHCTNYWTNAGGVVYRAEALQSLLEKRLCYIGSLFPVAALFRLRKFINRGYRISAGELTKIAYDISKINLDDPFVLKEQLMGCDVAYFNEVINILRREGKASDGKELDRTYLISVIDRVFNDHDIEEDVKDYG